jgi:hypothetical protein
MGCDTNDPLSGAMDFKSSSNRIRARRLEIAWNTFSEFAVRVTKEAILSRLIIAIYFLP